MKRKHSRYFIIIFLLVGIYPIVSVFMAIPLIPIKETTTQQSNESYYTENAYIESLGSNAYRFSTKLGMKNVYDGSNYVPYIYNPLDYSVRFAGSQLTFYDWYAVLEQDGEVRIDDLRLIVQRYTNKWNELDLWNHYFHAPIFNEQSMIFIQGYDDGASFMNVSYTISNYEAVKVTIDFLSGGDYELRFNWQLSGIQGDIIENVTDRNFRFSDVSISCNDTDNNIDFSYDWSVQDKKLDIYLGPYNVLIGDRIFIDPTFSARHVTDALDFYTTYTDGMAGGVTNSATMYAGDYFDPNNHSAGITYNTSITDNIVSIDNAFLSFYVYSSSVPFGSYVSVELYNETDDNYFNETEVFSNAVPFRDLVPYYKNNSFYDFNNTGGTNVTISCNALLNAWRVKHNIDPSGYSVIPLKLDTGIGDWNPLGEARLCESTYAVEDRRPTLSFDYVLGEETTTTTTTTTTTPTNITAESFTDEFFLIHFLNNLGLFLAQNWVIVLAVSAIIIILIKTLYS